jgi:hypothetical protein
LRSPHLRDLAWWRNFPRWKIGRQVRYGPDEILALLREDGR